MRSLFSAIVLIGSAAVFAASVSAQGLGSSNNLFGGSKPATTPAKKAPTAKKKVSSTKPPATTAKAKTEAKKTATKKPSSEPKRTTKTAAKPAASKPSNSTAKTESDRFKGFRVSDELNKGTAKGSGAGATRFENFVEKPPAGKTTLPVAASSQYEKLLDEGNDARDDRNYPAAEAAYKRARSAKPRDARAIYGLGNLYSDQQRWEEAENSYRTALQLDPNSTIAHIALSYVLIQPIAVDNLSDRYEEAEKHARRALELDRNDALANDQLGVALELRGLIGPETEAAYRRAIQLEPDFAPAYAHLGRLLRKKGRMPESADAYIKAIRLASDVPTKILVAEVMQSEQRFGDSEGLLRAAVIGDPRNPAALIGLGRALLTQSKFDEAETYLKRAQDISPSGFTPNSMLATLYLRRGMLEAAEDSLVRTVSTVPSYEKRQLSQQFEAIGDGYMKMGKARNAERAYTHALSLDGDKQSLAAKLARARQG